MVIVFNVPPGHMEAPQLLGFLVSIALLVRFVPCEGKYLSLRVHHASQAHGHRLVQQIAMIVVAEPGQAFVAPTPSLIVLTAMQAHFRP